MTDLVMQYGAQFAAIVAAAMVLSEWLTIPVGSKSTVPGKGSRKRVNTMIYSIGLGVLGYEANLVQMPGDGRLAAYAGVAVTAICAVVAAHLIVQAKKRAMGQMTGPGKLPQ